MSDIRYNSWYHRSGTGGVHQASNGRVGIGSTIPQSTLDLSGGTLTATEITGVSTIGVTTVTANTLNVGLTTITSDSLQVNGTQYPSSGPLSNRNFVINGGMQIAQRTTEVTGATAGAAVSTCDRWRNTLNALGTWTIRQSSDTPVGFTSSLEYVCTTADASPAAGGFCLIEQRVESQNLQSLGFGNADARSFTVSFWVKSNKTGAASFDCYQDQEANQRMFSTSYTINSANTWEHKVINVPGDASGDIPFNSDIGLHLEWWLNGGSTFTGGTYQTTWATLTQANRNVQNLGVGGAINDNFKITGVQMELGDVATPFEHRSFGDELARCQRYYFKTYDYEVVPGTVSGAGSQWAYGTTDASGNMGHQINFPTRMNKSPNITYYNRASLNTNTWFFNRNGTTGTVLPTDGGVNGTGGTLVYVDMGSTTFSPASMDGHITADAEI